MGWDVRSQGRLGGRALSTGGLTTSHSNNSSNIQVDAEKVDFRGTGYLLDAPFHNLLDNAVSCLRSPQHKLTCHPERTGAPGDRSSSLGWGKGPQTLFSSGVPKERSLLFGVEVGGGESKDLRLSFDSRTKNFGDHSRAIRQSRESRADAQGFGNVAEFSVEGP